MPMKVAELALAVLLGLAVSTFAQETETVEPPEGEQAETESEGGTEEEGEGEGEEEADVPAGPPPPPPTPDGILPVAELARFSYAPRERPLPLLSGNTLFVVTTSGAVDAYDAVTGAFSWKLGLPGERLFRPVVREKSPDLVLVASSSGRLVTLERASGEIVEERQLALELAVAPLGNGSELLLGTSEGEIVAYDLESEAVRFRTETGEPVSALAASKDTVVVSGALRTLTAIDLGRGELLWSFRGRGPFRAAAAIGSEGRRVYAGDDLGEFYSLGLEDGKVKYRWSTGGAVRSTPYLEGDRVYVATLGNNLYAYEAGGGDEQWRTPLPGRPISSPERVHERFLVATHDGILIEVHPNRGQLGKSWAAPGELAAPPTFRLEPRPLVPEVVSNLSRPSNLSEPAADEETETGDIEESPTREPLWFERSRVALALRNGDVLLLGHQVPVVAPPATEEPTDADSRGGDDADEDPPEPPPPPR